MIDARIAPRPAPIEVAIVAPVRIHREAIAAMLDVPGSLRAAASVAHVSEVEVADPALRPLVVLVDAVADPAAAMSTLFTAAHRVPVIVLGAAASAVDFLES